MCIAVNGAIERVRATHFFTLDLSNANRRRIAQRKDGVRYCVAAPVKERLPEYVDWYLRVSRRGPEPKEKNTPEWWFWRWSCVPGLSRMVGQINSGNSAWGALQLARKLGANKVALVGVDASQEPRIEGGTPNNLSHLPLLFESGLGDPHFQFINCGHMQSKVPRMSIEDGMKWLMQ